MSKKVTFKYDYTDVMRALRPFSSRPVTEAEWEKLGPRYISYYESQSNPPSIGMGGKAMRGKNRPYSSSENENGYSPDEIICIVDTRIDIPVKIYVYTGIRRGSDVILNSIELKVFDSKSDNFNYSVEEVSIKNDAKSHVLERLQKNVAKLIKKIKEDVKPCPEEGCDGLIVEKYSAKTKSNFWACNRYPKCEYIDKEKSKKEAKGIEPGPYDKACSKCGKKMVKRIAKKGRWIGKEFWGCSAYPDCKNTENI